MVTWCGSLIHSGIAAVEKRACRFEVCLLIFETMPTAQLAAHEHWLVPRWWFTLWATELLPVPATFNRKITTRGKNVLSLIINCSINNFWKYNKTSQIWLNLCWSTKYLERAGTATCGRGHTFCLELNMKNFYLSIKKATEEITLMSMPHILLLICHFVLSVCLSVRLGFRVCSTVCQRGCAEHNLVLIPARGIQQMDNKVGFYFLCASDSCRVSWLCSKRLP